MKEPEENLIHPPKEDLRAVIFPSPLPAFGLTVAALFATSIVASIATGTGLAGDPPLMTAMGIGYALGLGGVATLAARRVAQPHAQRIGLVGFSPKLVGPILLLLPMVVVVSELDNYWRLILPASPEFEAARAEMLAMLEINSPIAALQTVIVAMGIVPVVEGFFFFGVIQQGLVTHLDRFRGTILTAVLYSLVHFPASGAPGDAVVPLATWLVIGTLLGLARLASGSILPAILLSSAFSGIHLLAAERIELFTIPGFNAPGDHTPALILLPSVVLAGIGISSLWGHAATAQVEFPIPEPEREEQDFEDFF